MRTCCNQCYRWHSDTCVAAYELHSRMDRERQEKSGSDWKRQRIGTTPVGVKVPNPSSTGETKAGANYPNAPWHRPKKKVTLTPPAKSPNRSRSFISRRTPKSTQQSPTVKATNLQPPPPKAATSEQIERERLEKARQFMQAAPRRKATEPAEPKKTDSSTDDEDTERRSRVRHREEEAEKTAELRCRIRLR